MPPLRLTDVCLAREGRTVLAPLTWKVDDGERWIVLGANGSGKTTLIQIAALYLHPSGGTVRCWARPSADATCGSCAGASAWPRRR